MKELHERIAALEEAVKTIGDSEFGDKEGHKFHGNQYKHVDELVEDWKDDKNVRQHSGISDKQARRWAKFIGNKHTWEK